MISITDNKLLDVFFWTLGGLAVWALIIFFSIRLISKWGARKSKKWAINFQDKMAVRLMAGIGCLILPVIFLFVMGFLQRLSPSFLETILFPVFFIGGMGFYLLHFFNPYTVHGITNPLDLIFLFSHWILVIGLSYWVGKKRSFILYLCSFVFMGSGSVLLMFFIFEKLGYQFQFATP